MIEALAFSLWVYFRYGYAVMLWYWLVTSAIAWVLCGLFTRGRNDELEQVLREGCLSTTTVSTTEEESPLPRPPSVRRSQSGRALEIFSDDVPQCEVNPWVNATWRVTATERFKMSLLAPWVLPPRVAIIGIGILIAVTFANLATLGWDGHGVQRAVPRGFLERALDRFRHQRRLKKRRVAPATEVTPLHRDVEAPGPQTPTNGTKPPILPDTVVMPWWRLALGVPVLLCIRGLLCALGFWRVRVLDKHKRDDRARVIVCNHVSMIEPLLLLLATRATPVASADFARLPALGPAGTLYQLLWLDRGSVASRQAVVDAIKARVSPPKDSADTQWPPVMIFPEGTTLNGRALISFKNGAFQPGVPVQPVVATFPLAVRCGLGLDCSWTTAGPQFGELCIRMILQPWNRLDLRYLDAYFPSPSEKADPKLFAYNVRRQMATAMAVPTTDHSWADMWLNMKAKDLGEPPHKTLVSLGALRQFLGGRDYERERAARALQRFARADREKDGKLTLDQFRRALAMNGDAFDPKEVASLRELPQPDGPSPEQLLDQPAVETLFALLSRDNRTVDFFSFLVGFALLDGSHASERDDALRLVFTLLDASNEGLVNQSRVAALFNQDADASFTRSDEFLDDDAFVRAASDSDTLLNCEDFVNFVNTNRKEFRVMAFPSASEDDDDGGQQQQQLSGGGDALPSSASGSSFSRISRLATTNGHHNPRPRR